MHSKNLFKSIPSRSSITSHWSVCTIDAVVTGGHSDCTELDGLTHIHYSFSMFYCDSISWKIANLCTTVLGGIIWMSVSLSFWINRNCLCFSFMPCSRWRHTLILKIILLITSELANAWKGYICKINIIHYRNNQIPDDLFTLHIDFSKPHFLVLLHMALEIKKKKQNLSERAQTTLL